MPTYEYECKNCSHNFEVFQSMSDPPLKECPACGSEVRRLIFGGAGVIFKGSGFYVTDKGKGKGGKTAAPKTSGETSKSEAPCAPAGGTCANCPKSEAGGGSEKPKLETKTALN